MIGGNSLRTLGRLSWALTLGFSLTLASSASAQTLEEYTLTFESTWSEQTHPSDFPADPHYSPLVGGTHSSGVAFWDLGEVASLGMERMAEQGATAILLSEVQSAINDGTAESQLSGPAMTLSPGLVEMNLEVSEDFPLVTVVSMLAPSPDWWVGVGGLNLRPAGEWLDEVVVDLVLYDAGTDSGTEYESSNMDTDPQEPIFIKTDGPFATNNIVGTFTFTRTAVASVGDLATTTPRLLLPLSENPARDFVRFGLAEELRLRIASGLEPELSIFDVRGARVQSGDRLLNSLGVIEWNGENLRGTRVPSGSYFLSLRIGDVQQTERIVLVR